MRIFVLFLASSLLMEAEARDYGCSNSTSELRCVLRLYPTIYRENPEYFWKVLNQSRDSAFSCTSIKVKTDFLHIANLSNPGSDLEEFISEGIETLCVNQRAYFKRAMGALDKKTRRNVARKLETPLYFEVSQLSDCK